jgi:hypothetical protein
MMDTFLPVLMTVFLSIGVCGLLCGSIFGLVAVASLSERPKWKYGLVLGSLIIPGFMMVVCLLNYKKTQYASRFLLAGLVSMFGAGVLLLIKTYT